jgi:hypothetical protein
VQARDRGVCDHHPPAALCLGGKARTPHPVSRESLTTAGRSRGQDELDAVSSKKKKKKKLKRTVTIPTSGASIDFFSLLRVKSDAVVVPLCASPISHTYLCVRALCVQAKDLANRPEIIVQELSGGGEGRG